MELPRSDSSRRESDGFVGVFRRWIMRGEPPVVSMKGRKTGLLALDTRPCSGSGSTEVYEPLGAA